MCQFDGFFNVLDRVQNFDAFSMFFSKSLKQNLGKIVYAFWIKIVSIALTRFGPPGLVAEDNSAQIAYETSNAKPVNVHVGFSIFLPYVARHHYFKCWFLLPHNFPQHVYFCTMHPFIISARWEHSGCENPTECQYSRQHQDSVWSISS